MQLGEALFAAMAGQPAGNEPASFSDALAYLSQDYGSTSAMARDLGVARSTLRGWLGGRAPRSAPPGIQEQATFQWRSEQLGGRRKAAMRADWSSDSISIIGTYSYDRGKGPHTRPADEGREIKLGEYLNDCGEDLVDAFLDGAGPNELEEILVDAINDHGFYAETFANGEWDVEAVNWI